MYTSDGSSIVARRRSAEWSGSSAFFDRAVVRRATFEETWDTFAKVATRKGSTRTSVDGREYTMTVENYRRPGPQELCPDGGTIVLQRTKDAEVLSLTIELTGKADYTVVAADGRRVTRRQACTER